MFRMACIRFYDTRQRGEKSFSPLGLFRFIDVYGVRMDILHPIMKLEEFHWEWENMEYEENIICQKVEHFFKQIWTVLSSRQFE